MSYNSCSPITVLAVTPTKQHLRGSAARRGQDQSPEPAVRLPGERRDGRPQAPGHRGAWRLLQGSGESKSGTGLFFVI